MLPKKSIISPYCRLSRNQIAIYLHLSDLGRGKPFFCHCISGVGEPLVVGIRKRNRGAHSRLSVSQNYIKVWIFIISMHPHQITITIMNDCNNSDPLSAQGPPAGKLGTQKMNKWISSRGAPAAALEANWGSWLQRLSDELVDQVGRSIWIWFAIVILLLSNTSSIIPHLTHPLGRARCLDRICYCYLQIPGSIYFLILLRN